MTIPIPFIIFLMPVLAHAQESLNAGGMQSFEMHDRPAVLFEISRASRISNGRASTFWSTALVTVRQGVCADPQLLASFGHKSERVRKAFDRALEKSSCEESRAGWESASSSSPHALLKIASGLNNEDSWFHESGVNRDAKRNWDRITSQSWSNEALDRAAEECAGLCPFTTILALMFAKADYFDSVNRPLTGSAWRELALGAAVAQHHIRMGGKDVLRKHVYRLYQWSVKAADYSLAQSAVKIADNLGLKDPDYEKIDAHFSNWTDSRGAASTGITVPLVDGTPYSDSHFVVAKKLSSDEFYISMLEGSLQHAFLSCGNNWQVALNIDERTGWRIPPGIIECTVILFGNESGKVQLWEYPAGTLDKNGNLSA